MADTEAVTRASAIAAIEHVAQNNCGSREREAEGLLVAASAAVAGPSEAVKFTDQSTADPVEKARRYLTAMGDQRTNSAYFYDDGYPRRESAQDALATLAVLEQLAAAPTTQPAPAVPAAGVPDGWKLVPVEPTGVMKDCGAGSLPLAAARPWAAGDCYRAMLAAAPQPPTGVAADSAFMERVLGAMEGVIDVADRKTAEFDALRSCIVDLTLMLFSAAPQPQAAQKGGA